MSLGDTVTCLPLSPLEKTLTDAVICLSEEQGDEQTSIHCKISLFTHKYQIQRQMRKSLVYVSKAFDHATFSTFKKKKTKHQKTQLSPPETQNNVKYIHNTIKITISLFFCKSTILPYILQLTLYH